MLKPFTLLNRTNIKSKHLKGRLGAVCPRSITSSVNHHRTPRVHQASLAESGSYSGKAPNMLWACRPQGHVDPGVLNLSSKNVAELTDPYFSLV